MELREEGISSRSGTSSGDGRRRSGSQNLPIEPSGPESAIKSEDEGHQEDCKLHPKVSRIGTWITKFAHLVATRLIL